jgi:alpha-2-macroglobulin-like protein
MTPIDPDTLLAYQYGLLDGAEAKAVEAYLATHPQAGSDALKMQTLLAHAAKLGSPQIDFVPPASAGTKDYTQPKGWVVPAFLLALAAAVLVTIGPSLYDTLGYSWNKPKVDREVASLTFIKAEKARLEDEIASKKAISDLKFEQAKKKLDEVETKWIETEKATISALSKLPFLLDVQGPASALAGAPNEYTVAVRNTDGTPVTQPLTMEALVSDASGAELYRKSFDLNPTKGPSKLALPNSVWTNVKNGSDVSLKLSATDRAGVKSELTESLRMQAPSYTTFLTTDKPMYRPGEPLYFRSLTLDRLRLLPPEADVALNFQITAPDGSVVPGSQISGLARASTSLNDGSVQPILGPDGKPIRGVGTGQFTLPETLTGGEYTLTVTERMQNGLAPMSRTGAPLATRKFLVNQYKPEMLLKKLEFDGKTYGPGAVVQAKLDVKDQGKPLANAKIEITAQANNADIKLDVNPTTTDANGVANLKFTLPKGDVKNASVNIVVSTPAIVETINRPVPLATRELLVEFFPEGGDLIAGVPNRVYVRATTNTGKPADIVGKLSDDKTTFRTLTDADQPGVNQGMGVFEFTPEAGKAYSVKLSEPLGLNQPEGGYKLPEVKKSGVVLSIPTGVTSMGQAMTVNLTSVNEARTVLVGAYIRGRAVVHQTVNLEANKLSTVALDLGKTPLGGVTRVTVFDVPNKDAIGREELKPLAERLVFRTPGEQLKLTATPRKANGTEQMGPLVPGQRVELAVSSTDETGAPKPAVLWVAVVNKSVLTMADEKTERMMPTHFLLSGEVQKGEDLEHADFLLTAHPKAAQSLDLLLGTQGWRRFSEQNPAQFRQQVPAADLNRLQIASAMVGPIPTGWQPNVRRLFDEYWPQYEAAMFNRKTAEQERNVAYASGDANADLQKAQADYTAKMTEFGVMSDDLKKYDDAWKSRRQYIVAYLVGFLGMGLLLLFARGLDAVKPYRSAMLYGAMVCLVSAVALGGMTLATSFKNKEWRELAKESEAFPRPVVLDQKGQFEAGNKWAVKAAMPPPGMKADFGAGAEGMGGFDAKPQAEMMRPMAMPGMPAAPGGPGAPPPMARGFAPAPKPAGVQKETAPKAMMMKKMAVPAENKPVDADKFMMQPQKPAGAHMKNPGMAGIAAAERAPQAEKGELQKMDRKGTRFMEQGQLFDLELQPFLNKRLEMLRDNAKDETKSKQRTMNQVQSGFEQFLPTVGPLVVREYAHARPELNDEDARTDFTETLVWQPVLVTPANGRATIRFSLSDEVNAYRILVAGHSLDGRIGSIHQTLEVRKPLVLEPKLPQEISNTDVIDLPIVAINGKDEARQATVNITPDGLTVDGSQALKLDLQPGSGSRKTVRLTSKITEGVATVQLDGKAGADTDNVVRQITVVPDGFPLSVSKSEVLEKNAVVKLGVPKLIVPGSLKAKVVMYPNMLSEIQSGLEAMLREPNGCFEQTSTTNYPNVLVMDYLNETNQAKPEISARAKQLLDNGYAKLTSFECRKERDGREGYEWFGGSAPPHEALSAYGLLQFTDMARVHPVDAEMMKRTKDYLLGARDGNGGFKKNARAIDTFGYAPPMITNAYIVWALTESERTAEKKSDLKKEVDALAKASKDGALAKDSYYLGLLANVLWNVDRKAEATEVLKTLVSLQSKTGELKGASTSITNSHGESLEIEATALAVMAWLKGNEAGTYREAITNGCKFIGSKRSAHGAFGATQSTILALKALIEFARSNKRPAEDGTLTIMVNGKEIATKPFTTQQTGPVTIEIPNAEAMFVGEEVVFNIGTTAKQNYPITVFWECRASQPASAKDCPIELSTSLSKGQVTEGDAVRMNVTVKNLQKKQDGMVTAIVGIPAGLKLPEDMKQLKQLSEKPLDGKPATVSYWEKRGREVIFYWRGLDEKQTVDLTLDLIAEVPGEYRGPASRVYLYYTPEFKQWVAPLSVKVIAK